MVNDVSKTPGTIAKAGRLDSLTSLRFFAALMVFGVHSNSSGLLRFHGAGNLELSAATYATRQGTVGVSFFFILSGFVLAWSRRDDDSAVGFYRRRVARIVPTYWVGWIAGIVLISTSVVGIILGFLLLQAWIPIRTIYFGGNGVAWSLSVEAFFYAVFPLVIVFFARSLTARRQVQAMVALTVLSIAWALFWHPPVETGFRFWITYVFPPARLPEFCLGVLIALAVKRGVRSPISLSTALLIAIAAYLFDGFMPRYATSIAVTLIPFALLIYAAASTDLDGKPSFLRHRWLIRLGEWSYCFYLFHDLVLREVTKFLQQHHDLLPQTHVAAIPRTPAIAILAVLGSLVGTVILSGLVYHFWERPLEKRIRGAGPVRATSVI